MSQPERLLGLVGAGGMGRESLSFSRSQLYREGIRVVFVDDRFTGRKVLGIDCVSEQEFVVRADAELLFNAPVGDSRIRQQIYDRMCSRGIKPLSLKHETAYVGDAVDLGEGALLSPFCTLTVSVHVGVMFQGNVNSHVAHDCVLGDYVTLAPGVHCNGNVHVGDHAYLGSGATIRQGTPDCPLLIGEGAVVGMGAVVTKDVEPYTTVVGNPARRLLKAT